MACLALVLALGCGRSKHTRAAGEDFGAGGEGASSGAGDAGNRTGAGGATANGGVAGNGASHGGTAADDAGAGDAGAGGEFGEQGCSLDPLTGDAAYVWDVSVVTLELTVTLNGEPMPDAESDDSRGSLELYNRATGEDYEFDIGARGAARFRALVFAGNYDVTFVSGETLTLPELPLLASTRLATALAIGTDADLDFDLVATRVNGHVTLWQGPMRPTSDGNPLGSVNFRDTLTGSVSRFDVSAGGEGDFGGPIFGGRYDVSFQSTNITAVELPYAAETRLETGLEIERNESVLYYLRPMDISVSVTGNGTQLPDTADAFRAYLTFRDVLTGTTYRFDLGQTGPAASVGRLFEGLYDVTLTTSGVMPAPFPASAVTMVVSEDDIEEISALRYDVRSAFVNGEVSVNGGPMPDGDASRSRGSVSFRDFSTGETYDFDVGARGPARFSGFVFQGTYGVTFKSTSGAPAGLPAEAVTELEERAVVDADRTGDYDLRVVRVSGEVTSRGGPLPDSPLAETRGRIAFLDWSTGQAKTFELGATGPAVFEGELFAGGYAVTFDTADAELAGLPRATSTRVAGNLALASDQELVYDVRPIRLDGRVTVNGEPMPDSPRADTRGQVAVRDKFTNVTQVLDIGATGTAAFSAVVFEGSYDAALQTANDELEGLPIAETSLIATGCVAPPPCEKSAENLSGFWTFVFDVAGWGPLVAKVTESGGKLSGSFDTATDFGYFDGGERDGNSFTLTAALGTSGCSPLTLHGTLFDACGVSGYATCGDVSSYNPHFSGFR